MSFLQPLLLIALPLVALPVIIHLVNQRRFQTVRWGAMMFLLAANKMSRGYARLRQWLILAARMLAVAGLIFAISRPLASGLLGWSGGGRADATLVVIDRSPSMRQIGADQSLSKLETGRQQLARTLETIGTQRYVLIDSGAPQPREMDSLDSLIEAPELAPVSASADLPELLESALQYIRVNRLGRTDLWICSDLRVNDWQSESGRWKVLREAFQALPQSVSIHLLAYAEPPTENYSVRVDDVKRIATENGAELSMTLQVTREGSASVSSDEPVTVPLQFEIDGGRAEFPIEMTGDRFELKDYRIPIAAEQTKGFGKVALPADENIADNTFYFVFDETRPRKTIIVSEDAAALSAIVLAANIAPSSGVVNETEVVQPNDWASGQWDHVALVIWHGSFPEGLGADLLRHYVERGGTLIFMPTREATSTEMFGLQWQSWEDSQEEQTIQTWRGDQDLFAQTQSGTALPVGDLRIRGYAKWTGETLSLATLADGSPLFARVVTPQGAVYVCATLPDASASNLAENGIVLYVIIQRALDAGAASLADIQQIDAGSVSREQASQWIRVAGNEDALSNEQSLHEGVYQSGDQSVAVNRSFTEDHAAILTDERVAALFEGLEFSRVDDRAGTLASLVQEVWRVFLAGMLVALILEAALCLPKPVRSAA